jgi:hypothetical protein
MNQECAGMRERGVDDSGCALVYSALDNGKRPTRSSAKIDVSKRARTMLATWAHSAGGRSAYTQNGCGANAVLRGGAREGALRHVEVMRRKGRTRRGPGREEAHEISASRLHALTYA